jgi:hypothetical protein
MLAEPPGDQENQVEVFRCGERRCAVFTGENRFESLQASDRSPRVARPLCDGHDLALSDQVPVLFATVPPDRIDE